MSSLSIVQRLLVCAILCAAGCANAGGTDAAESALFAPLPEVPASVWLHAPAGCEAKLGATPNIEFAVASGEIDLVVALAADGVSICVDTAAAIEIELETIGHAEVAAELRRHYTATLALVNATPLSARTEQAPTQATSGTVISTGDEAKGDPNPQPNDRTMPPEGDPNPQPNDRTMPPEGDPNPQPNYPTAAPVTTTIPS